MKTPGLLHPLGFVLMMAGLVALSGCTAKGYITAAVQSVVGLDIGENPKTQVPHVRFGFVRNQYYYIPTGKSDCADVKGHASTCSACETPTLVSEIYVNSQFGSGTEIRERFAVGASAVDAPAATALFGGTSIVAYRPDLIDLQKALKPMIREKPDKAKVCIAEIASSYRGTADSFVDNPPEPKKENLQKLKNCLEKP